MNLYLKTKYLIAHFSKSETHIARSFRNQNIILHIRFKIKMSYCTLVSRTKYHIAYSFQNQNLTLHARFKNKISYCTFTSKQNIILHTRFKNKSFSFKFPTTKICVYSAWTCELMPKQDRPGGSNVWSRRRQIIHMYVYNRQKKIRDRK